MGLRIALIGYGRMGRTIEEIALAKGHEIVHKINRSNAGSFSDTIAKTCDVAIEFTGPQSAVSNILICFELGLPVVSGSTGWLKEWDAVTASCQKKNASFLYASNFSIGVNLFFEVNKRLAQLMGKRTEYQVDIAEIHHTGKKDAPSGTAITLAEQILQEHHTNSHWVNRPAIDASELAILSERIDPAPGTHKVAYRSSIDDIEITHTAHNRTGFASGAVAAAEFLVGKKGIFGMNDVLGL